MNLFDHGYLKVCEVWGHGGDASGDLEAGIISAARQSTQGNFRGWEQDERLLRYLHEHKHSTPFEFAGMVIEVQAPLFVFREWHRHRTQSYNEMSARYEPLPELYYVPTLERIMLNAGGTNRQAGTARDSLPLTIEEATLFQTRLRCQYEEFESDYQAALAAGIPKEIARCGMPVGHYSRMRASTNLRNWLAFLTLRCDPAAQFEIRQYANALAREMSYVFPHTMALFNE